MNKIITWLCLLGFTVSGAFAQNGWRTLKTDNRVIVQFPAAPKEADGNFTYTDAANITYIFKVVDCRQTLGLDSNTMKAEHNSPEFEAKVKAHAKQKLPGVAISSLKTGSWKGFASYTTTGTYSGKNYKAFMFIIGNRLYTLTAISPKGASTADRDKFLNSAQLTK